MNTEEEVLKPWNLIGAIEEYERPITVKELAAIRHRSIDTVYREVDRHKLPFFRDGGILFDPAALGMHYRKKYPAMAAAVRVSRFYRAA
jgi:hypothetical protein